MTDAAPFCWYELMTPDTAAAEAFYGSVIGWSAKDAGMPGLGYTIFSAGELPVAGVMALPDDLVAAGVPPHWTGYVRVEDVDAMLPRLTDAGGAIVKPAEDIPGVGRYAVVADLHGAVFCLFREADVETPAPVAPMTPGHVGWHELSAGDGPSAFAFYSGLFGWTAAEAMPMGELGVYQLFAAGGAPIGGMLTKMADCPKPFWLFYFNVPALDLALERVRAGGGSVILEPMEVPGGSWIGQCLDPRGAMFAVVAPAR
ncbi:MAG: VOC family protein [Siculibacillus sp.]|nr:VOC family protein [Siculibacillus sp.]